jgi:sugar-specific transcriptional regulator TrmB
MEEKLKSAGLTTNESKVYLTLIDLGSSLAGQIARKAGMHRRSVYDTTEMLISKGLIGYITKNNKKLFSPTSPKRFLEILQEKENNLQSIVADLEKKYESTKNEDETLFFNGINGLKSVFESQLEEKEILILGANENASDILKFYFNWYNKKRIKKKILTKIITTSKNLARMKNVEMKFLPKKYENPVAINIYGNTTAIIHWSKNPQAIVIKSKEITNGYKKYFDVMWNVAKVK